MSDFATVNDIEQMWRPLATEESERASYLLPVISDELRWRAQMVNRDLDQMVAEISGYANVAKEVTVSIVTRILRQNTSGEAVTQESQSGLGYSWSGTYAVAGGGIGNAIMNYDLKRLGLRRPRIGVIDFYDPRNDGNSVQ